MVQVPARARSERAIWRRRATRRDRVHRFAQADDRQLRSGDREPRPKAATIPYVIVSRPLVATPDAAPALGRPIVYVQGNIHSGEVEGKEALQALVRDLLLDPRPNALDSIVLIALPNYNADGNERLAPQARIAARRTAPRWSARGLTRRAST